MLAASAPVRIPEWARLEAADDTEREHKARKTAERDERNMIVEHEGTAWLGHVPRLNGGTCSVDGCGRTLGDHKLAKRAQLRPFNGSLGLLGADLHSQATT
jgi:hypothetical protein